MNRADVQALRALADRLGLRLSKRGERYKVMDRRTGFCGVREWRTLEDACEVVERGGFNMNVRLDRRIVLLQPTQRTTELNEQVPGEPIRWPTWANAKDVRGAEGVGLSGGSVEVQSSEVERVYRIRERLFGGESPAPGWAVEEGVEVYEVRYKTRPGRRRGERYSDLNCERRA